jgi:tetratricopeptide (TPR) repeat protein
MTFHLSTNSHLNLFRKALSSYSLAEKHLPKEFPDLLYNKGSVLCYLQDYLTAQQCFIRAHKLDDSLNAEVKIEFCKSTLNRIKKDFFDRFFNESLLNKLSNDLKLYHSKRGKVMQRGITKFKNMNKKTMTTFKPKSFSKLSKGENKNCFITAKVLKNILKTESGIHMFLIFDQNQQFAIMSIFGGVEGLESKIILKSSVVILVNPEKKIIRTGDTGERSEVLMLQIFNQDDLIIDNMK